MTAIFPTFSLVSKHLPAPSSGNHATNICIILPEMMQIHHRMMQIPRKGVPLSESAYSGHGSRQIGPASRQIARYEPQ